ncbi:MAG: hypothetical protein GY953_29900, partial [bacterium]|nr:hypothetical protein [bacterium]
VNRCRSCWDKAKDSEDRRPLCGYPNDADAALIVRAVNAHDGLVAALGEAREMLRKYEIDVEWPATNEHRGAVERIDAALRAAKGEA